MNALELLHDLAVICRHCGEEIFHHTWTDVQLDAGWFHMADKGKFCHGRWVKGGTEAEPA